MDAPGFKLICVTIDCRDPARVAGFWAALLGGQPDTDPDLPGWLQLDGSAAGRPRLNFQPVAEPKRDKVRVHLDLRVDDADAAIATVVALGGSTTGERHDYDSGVVVVLADPEGTEFCVVQFHDVDPASPAEPEGSTSRSAAGVRPMTDSEYGVWRATAVQSYAQEIAESTGQQLATVLPQAETQFRELLPDGLHTPNVWLLRVLDGDVPVGILWLGPHPRRPDATYVFDIEIDELRRGQGFGRAAMLAAERVVMQAGFRLIGLNVFGVNERARRLYDSLGYRTESTQMSKEL